MLRVSSIAHTQSEISVVRTRFRTGCPLPGYGTHAVIWTSFVGGFTPWMIQRPTFPELGGLRFFRSLLHAKLIQ